MGPFVPVHLASLKRAVGDLNQGTAWLRIFVMVKVPLTNGGLYSPNRLEETCFAPFRADAALPNHRRAMSILS